MLDPELDLIGDVTQTVRTIGNLPLLSPDDDYWAGRLSMLAECRLLAKLESKYNVNIPDDAFLDCSTARQLATLIGVLKKSGTHTGNPGQQ